MQKTADGLRISDWSSYVCSSDLDSEASCSKFLCGTAGTDKLAMLKDRTSGGSSKFVGIWHTHPISRGEPSNDDLTAMARLLFLQRLPPRQVVMLIVGFAETAPEFNYYLFHRNDLDRKSTRLNSSH